MESTLISTQYGKVHVWRGGTPHSQAILLIHAGLGDAEFSWSPIWDELSREHYVIAPDLPGFGLSPAIERPSAEKFIKILQEVLMNTQVRSAVVIGNSMGAGIAHEFAASYPHLTEKLVLINGCKFSKASKLTRLLLENETLHNAFIKMGYRKFFGDKALEKEFFHPDTLSDEKIEAMQANGMKLSEVGGDLWLNTNPSESKLRVPVSIFWGDEDEILPLKKGEELSRELKASFHPIVGTAHMPQIEDPKRFLSTLQRELTPH